MRNMFMESGFVSLNKHGESICGDFHTMVKNRDNTTVVLSDGLGSGVKANILSTLTAKILSTMMDNNMPIEDCIYTMADTLPVCKVRNLAYATFTILQVNNYDEAYLVQFDNPPAIMLRNGKNFDYDSTRKTICGKEIYESHIKLQTDDTIVLMSDGVTSAGLGKTNQSGWDRNNIISFLEDWSASDMSPQRMAATLADACVDLFAWLNRRRHHRHGLQDAPEAGGEHHNRSTGTQRGRCQGLKALLLQGGQTRCVRRFHGEDGW